MHRLKLKCIESRGNFIVSVGASSHNLDRFIEDEIAHDHFASLADFFYFYFHNPWIK